MKLFLCSTSGSYPLGRFTSQHPDNAGTGTAVVQTLDELEELLLELEKLGGVTKAGACTDFIVTIRERGVLELEVYDDYRE